MFRCDAVAGGLEKAVGCMGLSWPEGASFCGGWSGRTGSNFVDSAIGGMGKDLFPVSVMIRSGGGVGSGSSMRGGRGC